MSERKSRECLVSIVLRAAYGPKGTGDYGLAQIEEAYALTDELLEVFDNIAWMQQRALVQFGSV